MKSRHGFKAQRSPPHTVSSASSAAVSEPFQAPPPAAGRARPWDISRPDERGSIDVESHSGDFYMGDAAAVSKRPGTGRVAWRVEHCSDAAQATGHGRQQASPMALTAAARASRAEPQSRRRSPAELSLRSLKSAASASAASAVAKPWSARVRRVSEARFSLRARAGLLGLAQGQLRARADSLGFHGEGFGRVSRTKP